MKKKDLKSVLLLALILFLSMSKFAKELTPTGTFGENDLMLPRQVAATGDKCFVLDEKGSPSGSENIKIFSSGGKWISGIGDRGEGPGEFLQVAVFQIHQGKIFAVDSRKQCVHIFSLQDSKFIESKRYSNLAIISTILDFTVTADGSLYHTTPGNFKGEKLITRFNQEFKADKSFLDCIPLFDNRNELYSLDRTKPVNVIKTYTNLGYITSTSQRLYYSNWLMNRVVELAFTGEVLSIYTLPIESIDKTVKVIKQGQFLTIERKLNYDLFSYNERVYSLSRDTNGDSVIFELYQGNFKEKYRMKEKLFSCDMNGKKLYGIERDESKVFIYNLD